MKFLSKFLLLFMLSALLNPSAEAMKRKAVDAPEGDGDQRHVLSRTDEMPASQSSSSSAASNGNASDVSDSKDAKQTDGKEAKKEEASVEGRMTVLNSDAGNQSSSNSGSRQAARKNVFNLLQSRSIGEVKNPAHALHKQLLSSRHFSYTSISLPAEGMVIQISEDGKLVRVLFYFYRGNACVGRFNRDLTKIQWENEIQIPPYINKIAMDNQNHIFTWLTCDGNCTVHRNIDNPLSTPHLFVTGIIDRDDKAAMPLAVINENVVVGSKSLIYCDCDTNTHRELVPEEKIAGQISQIIPASDNKLLVNINGRALKAVDLQGNCSDIFSLPSNSTTRFLCSMIGPDHVALAYTRYCSYRSGVEHFLARNIIFGLEAITIKNLETGKDVVTFRPYDSIKLANGEDAITSSQSSSYYNLGRQVRMASTSHFVIVAFKNVQPDQYGVRIFDTKIGKLIKELYIPIEAGAADDHLDNLFCTSDLSHIILSSGSNIIVIKLFEEKPELLTETTEA